MASRFLAARGFASRHRSSFAAGVMLLLAGATGAVAQTRCEGTLCDFYYDHVAQPQPKQPATATQTPSAPPTAAKPGDSLLGRLFGGASPQQQPSGAAPPAKRPLVAVQGGGVVGLMHGDAPQRCTGTLCDLFYGGPPPEEPAARPVTPPATRDAGMEDASAPEPRIDDVAPRDPTPSCVASTGDPWHCYR